MARRRRHLRGTLVAVTGSAPAWRTALRELPIVRGGRWAVGGSASLSGRQIPVLPLPAMQVLLDATGNRERAAMIAKVLGGRSSPAGPGAQA